jgi:hypothetical protein
VQSLHVVINNKGVCLVYTPIMWKLKIPSRIHIFLWLLANNKIQTRDNLAKRKKMDDMACAFCNEHESVRHLFFECCVAQAFWRERDF